MSYNWVCRTWIKSKKNGWVSSFERFSTEEEAMEYGWEHVDGLRKSEEKRDFEIIFDPK